MSDKHTALFRVCMVALLANIAAFGQAAGELRGMTPAIPAPPTITILPAATGVLLRSQGAGNASLNLGRVAYFGGTSTPGAISRNISGSLVISTRFGLRVDCPGNSASSKVTVTMSRLDAAPSHAITIDGTMVRSAAQMLVQSMPCGSGGEHRIEVEFPASTPAGTIGSTVAFEATLNR